MLESCNLLTPVSWYLERLFSSTLFPVAINGYYHLTCYSCSFSLRLLLFCIVCIYCFCKFWQYNLPHPFKLLNSLSDAGISSQTAIKCFLTNFSCSSSLSAFFHVEVPKGTTVPANNDLTKFCPFRPLSKRRYQINADGIFHLPVI